MMFGNSASRSLSSIRKSTATAICPKNPKLGNWAHTQRQQYWLKQEGKESLITDARIKKLEGIGFEWNVHVPWEKRFEELKEFKKRFKHCNVPQNWIENRELSYWVSRQRHQYYLMREGKESSMTEKRVDLLESIDFQLQINGPSVPWEKRFEELKEFKQSFNHCNVPHQWEENRELGLWVMTQRRQYRLLLEGKPSLLTDERIELLESIDFQWQINDPQVQWEERFEELKEFKKRFKHCNVPQQWEENRELGRWVMTQRTQYRLLEQGKPSQMTEERIKLLEGIGFQWTMRKKSE